MRGVYVHRRPLQRAGRVGGVHWNGSSKYGLFGSRKFFFVSTKRPGFRAPGHLRHLQGRLLPRHSLHLQQHLLLPKVCCCCCSGVVWVCCCCRDCRRSAAAAAAGFAWLVRGFAAAAGTAKTLLLLLLLQGLRGLVRVCCCCRNYAHFDGSAAGAPGVHTPEGPYLISGPVKGDEELLNKIEENVKRKNLAYLRGLGITAETFYSCQGRRFPGFGDENEKLVEDFVRLGIDSCEMESHQLYHLCSEREKERKRKENEKEMKEKETKDNSNSESKQGPTRAASICLGVVNRVDPSAPSQLIRKSEDCTKEILLGAAEAALDALISVSI